VIATNGKHSSAKKNESVGANSRTMSKFPMFSNNQVLLLYCLCAKCSEQTPHRNRKYRVATLQPKIFRFNTVKAFVSTIVLGYVKSHSKIFQHSCGSLRSPSLTNVYWIVKFDQQAVHAEKNN
jgi:hypothetical protein